MTKFAHPGRKRAFFFQKKKMKIFYLLAWKTNGSQFRNSRILTKESQIPLVSKEISMKESYIIKPHIITLKNVASNW